MREPEIRPHESRRARRTTHEARGDGAHERRTLDTLDEDTSDAPQKCDDELHLRDLPATVVLGALCLLLFLITLGLALGAADDPLAVLLTSLWSLSDETGALRQLGALDVTRLWLDGEWWRLGTAALLHGSWLHLLLNLSALWSVGGWLEKALGGARAMLVFALSSLAASLASASWCEAPLVVGASGGIMGMAGALWFVRRHGPRALRARVEAVSATNLAVMVALCLGLGLVVPVIAQAGHLGGLVLGTVTAVALVGRTRTLRALAALAALLLLTTGAFLARDPTWRANRHLFVAMRHLADGSPIIALASFEKALELRPGDPNLENAVAYHLALAGESLDRAEVLVRRALEADPDNPDFLDTMGWIECRRGRPAEGLPWLERARNLSTPLPPEIGEHLATCHDAQVRPASD